MEPIEDCFIFLFSKAYQRVSQITKRRLTRYGVTPVQYIVLRALWESDGQSGAALGERLMLDSATLTGVIDRLEHAGLLQRLPDGQDRRIHRVALTEKGRALQEPVQREVDKLNRFFCAGFSAEEETQVKALLLKMMRLEEDAFSRLSE
uniref:MarR family transcriptional regulator n=1 Tax=Thermosporothrix sp. COM3 TaxID=2490863 RepID=A0A455SKH3_9CHLR|nr:MarR family transcriptional regulator [Thermosporothrix sp. COM3]